MCNSLCQSRFCFLFQCFDGVIVLASFIVDLVLLEGLQQFTVQEFVLILAFLVPWRIIRVVNSTHFRPLFDSLIHLYNYEIRQVFLKYKAIALFGFEYVTCLSFTTFIKLLLIGLLCGCIKAKVSPPQ